MTYPDHEDYVDESVGDDDFYEYDDSYDGEEEPFLDDIDAVDEDYL